MPEAIDPLSLLSPEDRELLLRGTNHLIDLLEENDGAESLLRQLEAGYSYGSMLEHARIIKRRIERIK